MKRIPSQTVSGSNHLEGFNKQAGSGKTDMQCSCSTLVFSASGLFFKVLYQKQASKKLTLKLIGINVLCF